MTDDRDLIDAPAAKLGVPRAPAIHRDVDPVGAAGPAVVVIGEGEGQILGHGRRLRDGVGERALGQRKHARGSQDDTIHRFRLFAGATSTP
jgi:hypothetical protein